MEKHIVNAQLGIHDEDVTLVNLKTKATFGAECKLAGKGRFKYLDNGGVQINIKCMRSRTLGQEMVNRLASQYKISSELLGIHNDQYLPSDFKYVITSIGNAFYQTDDRGLMYWCPNDDEKEWLKFLCQTDDESKLQNKTFNKIYIIESKNLSIQPGGYQKCTRKKCNSKNNCGFIPNYPTIVFDKNTREPINGWVEIENIKDFLN